MPCKCACVQARSRVYRAKVRRHQVSAATHRTNTTQFVHIVHTQTPILRECRPLWDEPEPVCCTCGVVVTDECMGRIESEFEVKV